MHTMGLKLILTELRLFPQGIGWIQNSGVRNRDKMNKVKISVWKKTLIRKFEMKTFLRTYIIVVSKTWSKYWLIRYNLSQIFEKFKITVFGAVVKFQGLKFESKSLLYLIQRWFSFRGELFRITYSIFPKQLSFSKLYLQVNFGVYIP